MPDSAGGAGLGELAIRLVGSLALVVGLLLLIARTVNKRFKAPAGATIQVVQRQALGRGQGVAVVSVGTRLLVLGTTEQQITLLAEVEPDEIGLDLAATDEVPQESPRGANTGPEDVPDLAPRRSFTGTSSNGLSGSVLSPQTWKDAMAAVTGKKAS
ncbi:flagellar biosynthetic protein FliO [Nocardioides albidus]|uniref:Flagellar biosynthetic protein FliO n=1 Tax=Nocardioides albidus TaxID=1517589 RepID=A0A5C4W7M3_9ACTN|nr:flagellar biosynthetic protein FliO [Nocardioides albidus]TNM44190.1 flagellar biosynthetic protein FliO [Nocardioides albidus]